MTPDELARQAVKVVAKVERSTLARIFALLKVVEDDALGLSDMLATLDSTRARVFKELRAREVLAAARAARELLQLGAESGSIAPVLREGIEAVYRAGVEEAIKAATATGLVTNVEAARAIIFGSGIDLEFVSALTRITLTQLRKVGEAGRDRLEEALVRGAVRGEGPRAAARLVRAAVDVTRHEAERITRTVFNRANNEARKIAFDDPALAVEYLQWNATNDVRTCPICAARHGLVWRRDQAPIATVHPHDRCVLLPWNPATPEARRGDDYYRRTRAELARQIPDGKQASPTTPGPFEVSDGITVPPPAWTPEGGWSHGR